MSCQQPTPIHIYFDFSRLNHANTIKELKFKQPNNSKTEENVIY